jgi:hypothetical protein
MSTEDIKRLVAELKTASPVRSAALATQLAKSIEPEPELKKGLTADEIAAILKLTGERIRKLASADLSSPKRGKIETVIEQLGVLENQLTSR